MYFVRTSGSCSDSGVGWEEITTIAACETASALVVDPTGLNWRSSCTWKNDFNNYGVYVPGCSWCASCGCKLIATKFTTSSKSYSTSGNYPNGKGLCTHICQKGQYQDQNGQNGCKSCPTGYLQEQVGQASCVKVTCPLTDGSASEFWICIFVFYSFSIASLQTYILICLPSCFFDFLSQCDQLCLWDCYLQSWFALYFSAKFLCAMHSRSGVEHRSQKLFVLSSRSSIEQCGHTMC